MKKLLLLLLATMCFYAVKSQDKIITIKNDTIECRIISVNADRISYEQKSMGNQVIGKTISAQEVLQYIRTENPEIVTKNKTPKPNMERPEQRWILSLQFGLSHSLNDYVDFRNLMSNSVNSSSDVDDYIRTLKNGISYNFSTYYLLTNFLGVGASYSLFISESNGEFLLRGYDDSGHNLPVYSRFPLDEKIYSRFAGATGLLKQQAGKNKKIRITEDITPGMVFFRDETRATNYEIYWGNNTSYAGVPPQYYEIANVLSTSNSFGLKGGLTLEYYISPKFSAGITGSFLWSKIKKITIQSRTYTNENQELAKKIDISRMDYGFSFRYNL